MAEQSYPKLHTKKIISITAAILNFFFGYVAYHSTLDGKPVTIIDWLFLMVAANIMCIIPICLIILLYCKIKNRAIERAAAKAQNTTQSKSSKVCFSNASVKQNKTVTTSRQSIKEDTFVSKPLPLINSTAQGSVSSNNAIKAVSENINIQEPLPLPTSEKEQISISLTPIVDAEPKRKTSVSVNSAHQELLKKYAIITPLDTTDFTDFDFFVEAGMLCIEHFSDPDKIKLIQRHLGIGFNRASRLCDQLVYYKVLNSKGSHYDVIMDRDSFYALVTTFHGRMPEKQFRPVTALTNEDVITTIDTTDFTDFDFFLHAGIVSITDPDHDKLRLIQRHLGIGFSHAARLCDILYYYKVLKSDMEKQCGYIYYNVIMDLDSFIKLTDSFHGHMPEESTSKELDYMMDNLIPSSKRGQHFETQCAELLKKNGFINVIVTKKSGDHGADVLAEKDGISYAVQCKYYSGTVGNSAVQEAFSAKAFYEKDIAVVMTNSYFTRQAQEEAAKNHVKLWDKDTLRNLLKSSHSNNDSLSAKEKLNREVDSYRADLELEAILESSASGTPDAKEA